MALPSTVPEPEVKAVPVLPGVPAVTPARRRRNPALALLTSARPRQWVKNAFVLVPAGFGGALGTAPLTRVALAAAAFCIASSSLYLINDVVDRDADRQHVRKRHRPIAAGELRAATALVAAGLGLAVSIALAALASPLTAVILAIYAFTTTAYSLALKHVAILDVLIIASGFVLRVLGGAAAAHVTPSKWLLLCMLFLALFLGFGKRRHELLLLGAIANSHRRVLGDYSEEVLDQFLVASMIGTLFSYALYTFLSPAGEGHQWLLLTIPFATYGILRYMLIVETKRVGGAPEELLITDRPLQMTALAWTVVAAAALYLPLPHLTW
jgi:4-hydroxybenzoate polyprenyltransferase